MGTQGIVRDRISLLNLIDRSRDELIILQRSLAEHERRCADSTFAWLPNPGASKLRRKIEDVGLLLSHTELALVALSQ